MEDNIIKGCKHSCSNLEQKVCFYQVYDFHFSKQNVIFEQSLLRKKSVLEILNGHPGCMCTPSFVYSHKKGVLYELQIEQKQFSNTTENRK